MFLGAYTHVWCSKPLAVRWSSLIAGSVKSRFPVHQGEPSLQLLPPRREGRSQAAATSWFTALHALGRSVSVSVWQKPEMLFICSLENSSNYCRWWLQLDACLVTLLGAWGAAPNRAGLCLWTAASHLSSQQKPAFPHLGQRRSKEIWLSFHPREKANAQNSSSSPCFLVLESIAK